MNNAVFNIVVHVLGLVCSTYVDVYVGEKLLFIRKAYAVYVCTCSCVFKYTCGMREQAPVSFLRQSWLFGDGCLSCFVYFFFL